MATDHPSVVGPLDHPTTHGHQFISGSGKRYRCFPGYGYRFVFVNDFLVWLKRRVRRTCCLTNYEVAT